MSPWHCQDLQQGWGCTRLSSAPEVSSGDKAGDKGCAGVMLYLEDGDREKLVCALTQCWNKQRLPE